MSYQNTIFPLFPSYDKMVDVNKDGNGKGTFERYNEIIGSDIDDELEPYIANLVQNNLEPELCILKFIPFLEQRCGYFISLLDDETLRRKVLGIVHRLFDIRGTKLCYEVMLNLIGLSVTITEHATGYSFDSPVTLDDANRRFDQFCPSCSEYTLELDGSFPSLDGDMVSAIQNIIIFNEPINADIRNVTYKALPVAGDFNLDFNNDFF